MRPICEACNKRFHSVYTPGLGVTKACFDCIVSGKHSESRAKRWVEASSLACASSSSSMAPPPGSTVAQWNESTGYSEAQGNLRANAPYRAREDKPTPRSGKRGGFAREWYAARQVAERQGTLAEFLRNNPKPQKPETES